MPLYSVASALLDIGFLVTVLAGFFLLLQLFLGTRYGSAALAAPVGNRSGSIPVPPSGIFSDPSTWGGLAVAGICLLTTLATVILLYAFINHDFIVEYVAQYSDRTLPLFYRITALWAGQDGSLLFWAWSVAISGGIFILLPTFKRLSIQTRLWFCLLFLLIMGFFLLLLALWSNPFELLDFTPKNGRGLNPLLQNPGMIFHPPLLFLGYGGFVVPGCLALAQALSGRLFNKKDGSRDEESWEQASRPFILIAWSLLTAGIILGCWWAYMELGWGGYWAWDPVENASLIPWLVASAYLHTAVIGSRRGKLQRTNVFLMALTTISAFFATYLVRSGVVQSLHAFGSGTVGTPLVIFVLSFTYLALAIVICAPAPQQKQPPKWLARTLHGLLLLIVILTAVCLYHGGTESLRLPEELAQLLGLAGGGRLVPAYSLGIPSYLLAALALVLAVLLVAYRSENPTGEPLEDITSKEGLLLIVAWLLLALSFIILVATMWPVIIDTLKENAASLPGFISSRLPKNPSGLEAAFYNRTCLPLFALFAVLLVVCPFRKWKLSSGQSGFSHPMLLATVLLAALALGAALWAYGVRQPVALAAAACSLAAVYGIIAMFAKNRQLASVRSTLAAHGVHIGLLLCVLGVAFSGPYQEQYTLQLERDQVAAAGDYHIKLNQLYEGESQIGSDGKPNFRFLEAELLIGNRNGVPVGMLSPQRRLYTNFETQTYAEVDTLFSFGKEIYATLLSIDDKGRATMTVNINPLVNWLWIGGTIMCLFPFLGLRRVRRLNREAV